MEAFFLYKKLRGKNINLFAQMETNRTSDTTFDLKRIND